MREKKLKTDDLRKRLQIRKEEKNLTELQFHFFSSFIIHYFYALFQSFSLLPIQQYNFFCLALKHPMTYLGDFNTQCNSCKRLQYASKSTRLQKGIFNQFGISLRCIYQQYSRHISKFCSFFFLFDIIKTELHRDKDLLLCG